MKRTKRDRKENDPVLFGSSDLAFGVSFFLGCASWSEHQRSFREVPLITGA